MVPRPRVLLSGLLLAACAIPCRAQQPGAPPAPPEPRPALEVTRNGPPMNRPPDDPGQPPAPGLFYVPGEYVPDGNGVTWRKGFWAQEQAGWNWVPARWARLSEGWAFYEGHWSRNDPRGTGGPKAGGPTDKVVEDIVVRPQVVTTTVYSPAWVPGAVGWPGFSYGYGYGAPFFTSGTGFGYVNGFGFGGIGVFNPYPVAAYGYPFGWGGGLGWGGGFGWGGGYGWGGGFGFGPRWWW